MRLWMVRLAGLLALAAVTALCVMTNAPRIEAELEKRATDSIASLGAGWADVEADGRDIIISGTPPDADASAQLGEAVESITGVRTVRFVSATVTETATTTSIPTPDPVFTAERQSPETPIVLGGVIPPMPDGESLANLLSSQQLQLQLDVDELVTADVHLKGAPEILAAAIGVSALLDKGKVDIRPGHIVVTGTPRDKEGAAAIREKFSPFLGLGYVLEMAEQGDEQPATAAIAAGSSAGGDSALNLCQQQIDSSLAEGGIRFRNSSAVLQHDSMPLLEQLAAMLKACPGSVVVITGHTDSRGDAAANQRLSEARANAVGDFLRKQGLAPSRIKTRGAGEAEPVASNNTADGRARNRRIEMTLEEME